MSHEYELPDFEAETTLDMGAGVFRASEEVFSLMLAGRSYRNNHLTHSVIVQTVRRIVARMVRLVSIERCIRDHDSRNTRFASL